MTITQSAMVRKGEGKQSAIDTNRYWLKQECEIHTPKWISPNARRQLSLLQKDDTVKY